MGKVKFSGSARGKEDVPWVIAHQPSLKKIGRIINQNLHVLSMNEKVERAYTPVPMISFGSARNWAVI